MERKQFLETIRGCRHRLNMAQLLKKLIFALGVGAIVGIGFQAVAFFVPFYYANLYTGIAVVLAVFTALIIACLKRSTMEQTALVMDGFGFQERIVTAYEHLNEEGQMVQLQREDAMRKLRENRDKIQIPLWPAPKKMVGVVLLFMALFGMVLMPSEIKDKAKQLHQIKQEAKEKTEEIEQVAEKLEQLEQEVLTKEQLAALREMQESLQSSVTEYKQADSTKALSQANEKLNYKYENMSNELSSLAESLQSGATPSIATAESMQAMANQLQKMSQNPAGANQSLASNQGQSGNNQNNQNGQGNQGGSQSGNNQNNQNGQGNQSGSQSGNNQNNQNSQGNQNGSQSGNNQNNQNSQGNQSGSQSGNSQNNQNGQGNQNGSQSGNSQNNQNGQGNQSGSQSGNGQGNQNGQNGGANSGNGRGTGSISTPRDYVSVPNGIVDSGNLTGNATNHDDSDYFRAQNGLSWEGTPVSYEQVIGSYEENAYEGIATGRYPSGMENVIKEYFASFN